MVYNAVRRIMMNSKKIGILILLVTGFIAVQQAAELTPSEFEAKYFKTVFKTGDMFSVPKLTVDESFFYIYDFKDCKISIYSKKDGKKIKTFGNKGINAGQFDFIDYIYTANDSIYVSSRHKLSIFSNKGNLVKELKAKDSNSIYFPINKGFIAERIENHPVEKEKDVLAYYLLDNELNRVKEVFKYSTKKIKSTDGKKDPWFLFRPCLKGVVYRDKLFVGRSDQDYIIDVFDSTGKMLYQIKKPYEKTRFTDEYKKRIMGIFKSMMGESNFKKMLETREFLTPEYIPSFINFFVDKDKIYVFKYPVLDSQGKAEVQIMDLKGNMISTKITLLGSTYMALEEKTWISFYDGKLYLLIPGMKEGTLIKEFNIEGIFKDN